MDKKKSVWEKIKKIFHFITSIIMYAVFFIMMIVGVALVVYIIDVKVNASKGVYKPPLYGAYVIISPSMEPTIKVNDAIIIKRVEPKKIKPNDIITFTSADSRYSGATITHRVVGITKDSEGKYVFKTKGDNNNTADSVPVKEDMLKGQVILKIPKIGYIQYFLSQSYGWLIAVVIPCLGIVIYDLLKLFKIIGRSKVDTKEKKKPKEIEVSNEKK